MRETFEEIGVNIIAPRKMGFIQFEFLNGKEQDHLVYFFRAKSYLGSPRESDEMKPEWFHIDEIPYEQMWSDDRYWLPLLLKDREFRGNFVFGENNEIVRHYLKDITLGEEYDNSYIL